MTNDDRGFAYGVMQLLFSTTTPGGHPGSDVLLMRRPDGVWLRLRQGAGDDEAYLDAFLDLAHCEQLADLLMDTVYTAQLENLRIEERLLSPGQPTAAQRALIAECPWCDVLGMIDGVNGPETCGHAPAWDAG
ncbi:hypothetical protein [Mycolicibacterium sp. XJ879]